MTDAKKAYDQISEFISNDNEKSLLLRGIADTEKHQVLLKALNKHGNLKGIILLIHTARDGMKNFFRWAELFKVKVPKKYGEAMKLSNLTLYFDNLTTKSYSGKYDNYEFDFMIIWPIQSVTKNEDEIQMIKELTKRQKTKKIIYLTIKEPWYNPDAFAEFADRVVQLDCEDDNPKEYKRILDVYKDDMDRHRRM
ncbi:hypothetical protein GCM10007358_16190 [Phocicoccus schoeneichii]|uniref:Uncharacterized protein n=1 Tax=Phocicoccus schoeneichii TaxID=1812261 RepID=A0A6V7RP69_9BACL|nr:hypothetical protein [Jeotgalicoccus schoeneichii]GGH55131.1 hypothetical protein GCM10007358_16190 [Jeotgalicoccus schoeneichii]CAD2079925.1 hypothetical protein JEOSCH030_01743 [Jeotgalicoccus schoeneichii]